jgi:hypothetical protein
MTWHELCATGNKRELIIVSKNSSAKIESKKICLYNRLCADGVAEPLESSGQNCFIAVWP